MLKKRDLFMAISGLFLIVLPILICLWFPRKAEEIQTFVKTTLLNITFENREVLKKWKSFEFAGKSQYDVVSDPQGGTVLQGISHTTSSVIYTQTNILIKNKPIISWKWEAKTFPTNKKNEVLGAAQDSDYAARVYVMFQGLTPFLSDIIQYILDDHFPEGTQATSSSSERIKMLVVRKGSANEWYTESRNIYEDYKLLFGKEPPGKITGIGFMSDSDDTRTGSEAYLKFIKIVSDVSTMVTSEEPRKIFGIKIPEVKIPTVKIPVVKFPPLKELSANVVRQTVRLISRS